MLTLCTMALLEEAANMGHEYTGGFDGLPSLTISPLFGVFEFNPLYSNTQYLYVLAVLFVCFVFVRTLVYSPFGQSLTGIRENMWRMHAVGSPVRARLITCYTISAAIAGIAGGLWAQASAYVNLSALSLDRAAAVLIILILGGYGRLYGAFVGAVAYMVLSHFLARFYPTAWQLGLGLLLVVIALFARNGILGIGEALLRRFGVNAYRVMTAPLLETRGLCRNFGALAAARDIDFRLEAGARHALIGPNGAGKTTFINLLTGVLPPTDGRGPAQRPRHHRGLAGRARQARHRPHVPDQPAVSRALGAGERLYCGVRAARRRRRPCCSRPASAQDVIDESMHLWRRCKLHDDAQQRVSELAYGRQRLVELAIALGLKPEVLLLDEPAAGVPSTESHIILDAIERCPSISACSSSSTTWTWCSASPSASP